MRYVAMLVTVVASLAFGQSQAPDWPALHAEILRDYQGLVRLDTTDPPGNETRVADYLKATLEAEGIPVTLAAKDPARANLIARLPGNGSKRPLLIMAHSDVVKVDPAKWTFPPFSATLDGGYIYGRGAIDDKSDLVAGLMTMVLLKRMHVALDRDVILVSEAGEEASTGPGIEYLVSDHWPEIDAETCLAESGGVVRRAGRPIIALVATTEKQPKAATLVAKGPSGHGSRPLRTNAILHLAEAIEKISLWDPPMRFNDTTRAYFEGIGAVSTPQESAEYHDLFDPAKSAAAREYLAVHDPAKYSMLHTSISANMVQGGFQVNVIPSEAQASLDIRALPGEDIDAFYDAMRHVINDPSVEIVPNVANARPPAPPSSLTSDAFHAIVNAYRDVYGVATLPEMQTGATDMAFLRAKGMACYGIGPMTDEEDGPKGFGPHSDQERLLEAALYDHVRFLWQATIGIAAHRDASGR